MTNVGAPATSDDRRLHEAAVQFESLLIRQIVTTAGVFKGGEGAGSTVRSGMFADALADAVARSGGIGIAAEVERSIGGRSASSPSPSASPSPAPVPVPATLAPSGLPTLSSPLTGRVTSAFGPRSDPFTAATAEHDGIDVAAPAGTPIRSPAAGVVVRAGPRGGYGNAVEIDHGNGLVTLYGHASKLTVSKGDVVQPGQEIAEVGSTGRSTGPHLHFEVRVGGRPVDPARVLKAYAIRAEGSFRTGP